MPFLLATDKKRALLAYKEKLLNDIKYYEKRINNELQSDTSLLANFEDSSDSEDECPFTIDNGPMVSQLKAQQDMLRISLHATQELSSLYIQQSKVDIMVDDPVIEGELPVTKPGLWREVIADCRIDLIPFSTTFYVHQANDLFGAKSYRSLKVLPVKPAQEVELAKSVLSRVATPSDAVEVLRNYSIAYRSRRTTLARLADRYAHNLYMEPMPSGGYLLKCADLLEISWVLENRWSRVAPFYHKMLFDLEKMDKCYIKIINHAHKQLRDPSTDTNERTLILSKIIDTCLEVRGAQQQDESMESDTESAKNIDKRRLNLENDAPEPKKIRNSNKNNEIEDINMENKENANNIDDQIMAPPRSLPKKVKRKGKENTDQNRKSVKRVAVENDAGNVKKAKTDKNNENIVRQSDNDINKAVVNKLQDSNKNATESKNNKVAKVSGKLTKEIENEQTKASGAKDNLNENEGSTENVKGKEKVAKSQNLKNKVDTHQINEKESVKNSQTEKKHAKTSEAKNKQNAKEKEGSTENVVGKEKVAKSQNLKNQVNKHLNSENESIKDSQTEKEQTKTSEQKNNQNEKEGGTENVYAKEKVAKSQNLKNKVNKNQNNENVKDQKAKYSKSKNQEQLMAAKENSDMQKENNIHGKKNLQDNPKKKVVKDTESQKVVVSSKNDQKVKNSETKEIANEKVVTNSNKDQNNKNSEIQKVRSTDKIVANSNNDANEDKIVDTQKSDQIPEKNAKIIKNNANLLEIDDIPIMSAYNANIDKAFKKYNTNVNTIKSQRGTKSINTNEKAVNNYNKVEINFNIHKNNKNKESNAHNLKKPSVAKETKLNKLASDNAVSTNNKPMPKSNLNKASEKQNNHNTKNKEKTSNDIKKNTTQKKPTPKDYENPKDIKTKEIVVKDLKNTKKVTSNQEKTSNPKENSEHNPKVTESQSKKATTEKIVEHSNVATKNKDHMVDIKKSNAKPKMVIKNFATAKKLNISSEIRHNKKIITSKENDSGSKTKIPTKLSVHESLKKNNPKRMSPRRLPTFKSTSESNVKQKNYFTNIPRLTTKTCFNKFPK